MDNIYKNIEEYNANKERKILIAFDDMIAYMLSNKKINSIVTNLKISFSFITQSYIKVPKDVKLNTISIFFIMKILNKYELEQIAYNHLSDIDFKDFMNLYKKCTAKPYFFLAIDAILASDNPLRVRKNLLERI